MAIEESFLAHRLLNLRGYESLNIRLVLLSIDVDIGRCLEAANDVTIVPAGEKDFHDVCGCLDDSIQAFEKLVASNRVTLIQCVDDNCCWVFGQHAQNQVQYLIRWGLILARLGAAHCLIEVAKMISQGKRCIVFAELASYAAQYLVGICPFPFGLVSRTVEIRKRCGLDGLGAVEGLLLKLVVYDCGTERAGLVDMCYEAPL